jgi:hypothetical protein
VARGADIGVSRRAVHRGYRSGSEAARADRHRWAAPDISRGNGAAHRTQRQRLDVGGESLDVVVLRVGNPQCVVLGSGTAERLHRIGSALAVSSVLPAWHQRGIGLGRGAESRADSDLGTRLSVPPRRPAPARAPRPSPRRRSVGHSGRWM